MGRCVKICVGCRGGGAISVVYRNRLDGNVAVHGDVIPCIEVSVSIGIGSAVPARWRVLLGVRAYEHIAVYGETSAVGIDVKICVGRSGRSIIRVIYRGRLDGYGAERHACAIVIKVCIRIRISSAVSASVKSRVSADKRCAGNRKVASRRCVKICIG